MSLSLAKSLGLQRSEVEALKLRSSSLDLQTLNPNA